MDEAMEGGERQWREGNRGGTYLGDYHKTGARAVGADGMAAQPLPTPMRRLQQREEGAHTLWRGAAHRAVWSDEMEDEI